jgi:4-amino-4-deoxy-L-arabinose transferase-like glycosyltransferase
MPDPQFVLAETAKAKDRSPLPAIAFLCTLIMVGGWLRFHRLETGLWFDEIATLLDSVRHPLAQIVTQFPSTNDHPLYSLLAHLSISVFGDGAWALRLPAAAVGVASIPLLYVLGRTVTNRLEAGAAALMMTVSYHHIWFSQNARGYTLLLVFVLLSTYGLIRWLDTGRRLFLWVYAISIALGAYTHLTMVLVCLSHALVCTLDCVVQGSATRTRREWKALTSAFVGAGTLTAVLYAPILSDVSRYFGSSEAVKATSEVATPLWAMLATLRGLQTGFGQGWAVALGGLVFGAGAWSYFRRRSVAALLFLAPAPAILFVMAVIGRPIRPRFVFFAIGFGLLMAVRGAAWMGERLASLTGRSFDHRYAAAMVSLLTAGVVALSIRSLPYGYQFPKQDYEQAVQFVEQRRGSGVAAAIASTSALPVLRYLGRPWERVDNDSQLRALREKHSPIWVVYTFPEYIEVDEPELWALLQRECAEIRTFDGTVEGGDIIVRRCP